MEVKVNKLDFQIILQFYLKYINQMTLQMSDFLYIKHREIHQPKNKYLIYILILNL